MQKKNVAIVLVGVVVLIIIGVVVKNGRKVETLNTPSSVNQAVTQKSKTTAPVPGNVSNEADADKDGVPDVAEVTLGTDPNNPDTDGDGVADLQDKDPVFSENPIKNDGIQQGFKIVEALVENNVDAITKKDVNDHLEVALQNLSGKDLTGFEVYYMITDPTSNKKEGYYKKLSSFVLKSGEKKSINFDNGVGDGHFSENPNSIYRTNNDAKVIDIFVNTAGYKMENIQINKDPGGAEKAD